MVLWLLSVAVLAQDTPAWSPFAKLQEARSNSCAVRLAEPGSVLITGGMGSSDAPLASVEMLSKDAVAQYVAPLNIARSGHTCTLLNDGRVLVTGGSFHGANAEVYDPAADLWLPITSAGPSRSGSTATVLNDGRVLIAGGYTEEGSLLPYVEIFDPSSNRFTASRGQMNNPRRDHAAALLSDGRVVLVGGTGLDGASLRSSEFFEPLTSIIWTGPDLISARRNHTASTLADGRVLVAGGQTNTVETLDPLALRWTTLAARLSIARSGHVALPIPGNGGLLIQGDGSAEVFETGTSTFRPLPGAAFEDLSSTSLVASDDGDILACGGVSAGTPQDGCLRLQFPAVSFAAPVFHPREIIHVWGKNFPANTPVFFNLEFVRGSTANATVLPAPQFRILTQRAITNASGTIDQTPLFQPLASDIGAKLRVTATFANGEPAVVHYLPLKYVSELTFEIPRSTVEGQNLALNVLVKPVENAPSPTGPVTTTFGPLTLIELLNSASATTYSNAKLPTGALSVTSVYPGDAYYDTAVLRTTLGVASRTPLVDILTSTLTPQIGVSFTVYAQVRVEAVANVAGSPAPSGAVTFYESGVPIGEGKVLWTTNFPVPQMLVSRDFTPSHFEPALRFSATYAGDATYRPASSGTVTPVVQRALPNLSLVAVPSIFNLVPPAGQPVRFHCDVPISFNVGLAFPPTLDLTARGVFLTATRSSGTVLPLGNGTLEIVKAGTANALTTVTLPNDTIRVQATYPGDGLLRPATSAAVPMAIIPVPVQVQIAASAVDPATDYLVLSSTVTNDAGRGCQVVGPGGNVEFYMGSALIGTAPVNQNGVANLRILRPLVEGPQEIFARYTGDALHTPTDSTIITVRFN